MRPMVSNRLEVRYHKHEHHTVVADSHRLHQVVHVVVVNALKYTRKVRGGGLASCMRQ